MKEPVEARVTDLTHEGKGVVRHQEKVYFVDGVLPGESILFVPGKKRKGKFEGELHTVLAAAETRVEPDCEYFGVCGGCALQHLNAKSQIQYKEKILLDNLQRIGKVEAREVMAPIVAHQWGYRRKARLGAKHVPKKGGVLVGFRERNSSFITSLQYCKTLDPRISVLLPGLHELIGGLSCFDRTPQVEVAAADNGIALVLRHLEPLEDSDIEQISAYARAQDVWFYAQSKGPDSVVPIYPKQPNALVYSHSGFNLALEFAPLDFIQVNDDINQLMVRQAVDWLRPSAEDRVLDLFCGLGNFTLPLATRGCDVVGMEGDQYLVDKGNANAKRNNLTNVTFQKLDLQTSDLISAIGDRRFTQMLLDPPRSGALDVVQQVVSVIKPQRLVYVSCNPATLARDADMLVNQLGYSMTRVGAIDMFPNTAHVESMAQFDLIRGASR